MSGTHFNGQWQAEVKGIFHGSANHGGQPVYFLFVYVKDQFIMYLQEHL